MKAHVWELEEIDGGVVGINEFWICKACGANGGPMFVVSDDGTKSQPGPPFIAGSGIKLSLDCDEARQQIERHERILNGPKDPPSNCPDCGVLLETCSCGVWECGRLSHLRKECPSERGTEYRKKFEERHGPGTSTPPARQE